MLQTFNKRKTIAELWKKEDCCSSFHITARSSSRCSHSTYNKYVTTLNMRMNISLAIQNSCNT